MGTNTLDQGVTTMPAILKSFFDRNKQPDQQEVRDFAVARMALQTRVEQLMRQESSKHTHTMDPCTDRFGRALQ